MRRGIEWTVPMVPGLVSVMVVRWKSSTVSFPWRALRTTSSYAAQNWAKSIVSAFLMDGTRSWRVPSSLGRSMASPRFTWAGLVIAGLPSSVRAKLVFMSGTWPRASTSA